MRRAFTGPFWVLLVFGLLLLLTTAVYVNTYIQSARNEGGRSPLSTIALTRILIWPAIFLAESLVYWLIRRRNRFRALSWAHCVIFMLAFLLNILFSAILIFHYRMVAVAETRVNRQIMMHEQQYFFWGLVIVAHLAFFAVLANCLRNPGPDREDGGQENLLDDVVL
ncbi:MAG TPA: hypothetical protein VMH27_00395 [Puia sp.]|nr:hypothetical protein [Puia sp.]